MWLEVVGREGERMRETEEERGRREGEYEENLLIDNNYYHKEYTDKKTL